MKSVVDKAALIIYLNIMRFMFREYNILFEATMLTSLTGACMTGARCALHVHPDSCSALAALHAAATAATIESAAAAAAGVAKAAAEAVPGKGVTSCLSLLHPGARPVPPCSTTTSCRNRLCRCVSNAVLRCILQTQPMWADCEHWMLPRCPAVMGAALVLTLRFEDLVMQKIERCAGLGVRNPLIRRGCLQFSIFLFCCSSTTSQARMRGPANGRPPWTWTTTSA